MIRDRLYRYWSSANTVLCLGVALGLPLSFWGPLPALGGFLAGASVAFLVMARIHC